MRYAQHLHAEKYLVLPVCVSWRIVCWACRTSLCVLEKSDMAAWVVWCGNIVFCWFLARCLADRDCLEAWNCLQGLVVCLRTACCMSNLESRSSVCAWVFLGCTGWRISWVLVGEFPWLWLENILGCGWRTSSVVVRKFPGFWLENFLSCCWRISWVLVEEFPRLWLENSLSCGWRISSVMVGEFPQLWLENVRRCSQWSVRLNRTRLYG